MDLIMPDITQEPKIVTCTIEGILEEADLQELLSGEAGACSDSPSDAPAPAALEDPSTLTKLRERHHSVARLVARGMSQELVATICNYTSSYLSVLLNNPAMQELINHYRIQAGNAADVVVEKLKTVGLKAMEKLEEAIDADKLNNTELIGAAKLGLDRAGHGPTSKVVHDSEHHIFDHAALEALNRDARQRNKSRVVSVEAVRQALPGPKAGDQAGQPAPEDASFEPADTADAGD